MRPTVILSTTLALLAAGQASALSCIRPDPAMTFNHVASVPEPWFILLGELTFDEALLPEPDLSNPDQSYAPIPASFRGKGLTKAGFTSEYVSPVQVQIECAGPWCGSAVSGGEALYFVRADSDPATIVASPCGEYVFPDPTPEVIDRLTGCINAGLCAQ